MVYSHSFRNSQRKALYFGKYPYTYGNITHPALPVTSDHFIHVIYSKVCEMFPGLFINSVLVHSYPSFQAGIPFHSDNEPGICPISFIITLSLGATRYLCFRGIGQAASCARCIMRHGDIIIMTRSSQNIFEHGILQENNQNCNSTPTATNNTAFRFSLTFRQMRSC